MTYPILKSFLEAMSSERNFSKNSLCAYKNDLIKFHKFQSVDNVDIKHSSQRQIENFLKTEFDHGLTANTRSRRLSSIKQFFRFLLDEGLRSDIHTHTFIFNPPYK